MYKEKALTRAKGESNIIRKCLARSNEQSNFFSHEGMTIVYKRFTTLTFICGVSKEENEMAIQELLGVFMECLLSYFHHISELDIVYNMEKVYIILDEVINNGSIAFTSKERALLPLQMLDAGS